MDKKPHAKKLPPESLEASSSFQSYESVSRPPTSAKDKSCKKPSGTTIRLQAELRLTSDRRIIWSIDKLAGNDEKNFVYHGLVGDSLTPGYAVDVKKKLTTQLNWEGEIRVTNCGAEATKGLRLYYELFFEENLLEEGVLAKGDYCIKVGKKLKFTITGHRSVDLDPKRCSANVRLVITSFIENFTEHETIGLEKAVIPAKEACHRDRCHQNIVCGPQLIVCEKVKFDEEGCCRSVVFTDVLTGLVPSLPSNLLLGPRSIDGDERIFIQTAVVTSARTVANNFKEKNVATIICNTETPAIVSEATTELQLCQPAVTCNDLRIERTRCQYDYLGTTTPSFLPTSLVLRLDPLDPTRYLLALPDSDLLPFETIITRSLGETIESQAVKGVLGITGCPTEREGILTVKITSSCGGEMSLTPVVTALTDRLILIDTGDLGNKFLPDCNYRLHSSLAYATKKVVVQPDLKLQVTDDAQTSVTCDSLLAVLDRLLPSTIEFVDTDIRLIWTRGLETIPAETALVTIEPILATVPIVFTNNSSTTTFVVRVTLAASEVQARVGIASPYTLNLIINPQVATTCGDSGGIMGTATPLILNLELPETPSLPCCSPVRPPICSSNCNRR